VDGLILFRLERVCGESIATFTVVISQNYRVFDFCQYQLPIKSRLHFFRVKWRFFKQAGMGIKIQIGLGIRGCMT